MLYSATYRSLGLLQSGIKSRIYCNPNNNNGWVEVDVPLPEELGAEADEQMTGLMIGEITEPMVEMEEEMIAPVIDAEEDIAMLFEDDDFSDDDSKGIKEEEVWEVHVMASQMVHAADRFEQIDAQVEQAVQQRYSHIQQLQTMVSEMSSRESMLMQCILRMDRQLVDLERRPPGPQ
nr:hypothetical protein [Tanacetum cinerariifolium]